MQPRGSNSAVTHIRDPVHGEIGLSELEYDVIDKPEVQRLREINQLGAVRRVYPSATHTRFEHSLGVMHIAGILANSVGLSDDKVTECRLAGLLHDTGHGPFSHTSERVAGGSGFRHEKKSVDIAKKICSDYEVDTDYIVSQISGDASPNIISSVIDCDRLDYLLRDSTSTAVDHGLVDVNSILRFGKSIDGNLAFDEKAVPSINSLLSARLRMRRVVYRYSTVRHFDTLLFYAIRSYASKNGLEKMLSMDDAEIKTELKRSNNKLYRKLCSRELTRTRIELGTENFSKQDLTNLSNVDHDKISSVVDNIVGCDKSILVSKPYVPDNLSKNIMIDGTEGETLDSYSEMPQYVNKESWKNTSLILYIPKNCMKSGQKYTDDIVQSLNSNFL